MEYEARDIPRLECREVQESEPRAHATPSSAGFRGGIWESPEGISYIALRNAAVSQKMGRNFLKTTVHDIEPEAKEVFWKEGGVRREQLVSLETLDGLRAYRAYLRRGLEEIAPDPSGTVVGSIRAWATFLGFRVLRQLQDWLKGSPTVRTVCEPGHHETSIYSLETVKDALGKNFDRPMWYAPSSKTLTLPGQPEHYTLLEAKKRQQAIENRVPSIRAMSIQSGVAGTYFLDPAGVSDEDYELLVARPNPHGNPHERLVPILAQARELATAPIVILSQSGEVELDDKRWVPVFQAERHNIPLLETQPERRWVQAYHPGHWRKPVLMELVALEEGITWLEEKEMLSIGPKKRPNSPHLTPVPKHIKVIELPSVLRDPVSSRHVLTEVAALYGFSREELLNPYETSKDVRSARVVAAYILRRDLKMPSDQIARVLNVLGDEWAIRAWFVDQAVRKRLNDETIQQNIAIILDRARGRSAQSKR